jgi:predicted O-methyltransferase YrrM
MTNMFKRITRKVARTISIVHLNVFYAPWRKRFAREEGDFAWSIFTHTEPIERLLLYRLALGLPPNAVALEIGSYLGASACFLAAGLSKVGDGTKLFCVDTWNNDAMTEGGRDTYQEFLSNTEAYMKNIIPLKGFSDKVAETFDTPINLLFIDGDHSYEGCRKDILAWLPHLKKNGIIVMHDFRYSPGVKKAVGELIEPIRMGRAHCVHNIYWTRIC